jgi:hypothetical protein
MEMVRLAAPLDHLADVVAQARTGHLVFCCTDADTVIAVASLEGQLDTSIGVWLDVDDDYPAQMAARDVATLSWLVDLDAVVVAGATLAVERAEVVRALLDDGPVYLANAAATLVGAYNRPAPPRPVTVWSFDGLELRCGDHILVAQSVVTVPVGELTTFA